MALFRISKKLIFTAVIIAAIAYYYNSTKKAPEELSEMKKAPQQAVEISEIPQVSEDVIQKSEFDEEQKILSFDMTGYTDDGRKKWDIQGKSADIVSDTAVLDDIKANAYSDDRQVMLKAESGEYNKKENSVKLENNVVVTTSDGVILEAEWLKWESETNSIKTDSFVEVKKDDFYASGYGALASTEHKEVQLNKDIVVKQGDIIINCKGPLMIDYGRNEASFYDGVKVIEPRGELLADRLDIFFNSESRQIEEIVAEGNVELRQGENIAKGQKIVYTIASGEAILTGNPEVVIYSKEELENALIGD